MTEDTTYWHQS